MTMYVSPDTVNVWTEVPGDQRLIPDSQVFVGGRSSSWLFGYAGGLVAGAIGAGVGAAIDVAANSGKESAASSARSGLQINFSKDLSTILKDKIASRSVGDRLSMVDAGDNAQLTLLPSAIVQLLDNRSARLEFRLTVRFTDAITNSPVRKTYYYLHAESKPVAGPGSWTEDDAKAFKAIAAEALAKQTDVWLDDVLEGFAAASEPAKQRFVTYTIIPGKQIRAVLLREYQEYIAVAPVIRGLRDHTAWGVVVILERGSVVMGD